MRLYSEESVLGTLEKTHIREYTNQEREGCDKKVLAALRNRETCEEYMPACEEECTG